MIKNFRCWLAKHAFPTLCDRKLVCLRKSGGRIIVSVSTKNMPQTTEYAYGVHADDLTRDEAKELIDWCFKKHPCKDILFEDFKIKEGKTYSVILETNSFEDKQSFEERARKAEGA